VDKVARLSKAERDRVRDFVRHVVEWSGQSWDDLAYAAGVPFTTVQGWRYGRATPEAPGLLAFLRAAGVLDDAYKINFAKPGDEQEVRAELEAAKRDQEGAAETARALHARDDRESAS
jgi:hypothetical protein